MEIPKDIESLVRKQPGEVDRVDIAAVDTELNALGIAQESEIGAFLQLFKVGNFQSTSSREELLDIASPSAQMRETTEWLRNGFELDNGMIALTSFEAEGGYIYSVENQQILDLTFPNTIEQRWETYFDFIRWYLSG